MSHIDYVKDNAKNTQRHADSFLHQMSHRVEERAVLDFAEDNMLNQFSEEVSMMSNCNSLKKRQIQFAEKLYTISRDDASRTEFVNGHAGKYQIDIDLIGDVEAITAQQLHTDEQCKIKVNTMWLSHNKYIQNRGREP